SAITATSVQSSWPVEVRLIFVALTHALGFIVIKYLTSWFGVIGVTEKETTEFVNNIMSFISGENAPQHNQPLYGSQQIVNNVNSQVPLGGIDIPAEQGPLSGLGNIGPLNNILNNNGDLINNIANLGSAFISNRTRNNAPQSPQPVSSTRNYV